MRYAIIAAAALAPLCWAAPAFAHAHLTSAAPAVGSDVETAPTEVAITFSEDVEPSFSTISVQDAHGVRVDRRDPHTEGAGNRLAVSLNPLASGVYKVVWHATSTDTHKTQGSFVFTVVR